jgi:hypothetical protein
MFSGTKATVSIHSEEPDSQIFVNNVSVGKNTAIVPLSKKGYHTIRVSKEGCTDAVATTGSQFDATSLLGILIDFGIVSMLIIDGAATGAITDIEPKNYIVTPTCNRAPAAVR